MELFYTFNSPVVANEMFDEEAILVHFESGFYYNVRGVGAAICGMIGAGYSVADIVNTLANHFGLAEAVVAADTECLVANMVEAQLLVPKTEVCQDSSPKSPYLLKLVAYEPPIFEKFDDLADQLLLDKLDQQAAP